MTVQTTPAEVARVKHEASAANSIATAFFLPASAGFLDAFGYLGHGHTFASAITGNMVLFGISLMQSGSDALTYCFPLVAYVIGAAAETVFVRVTDRTPLAGLSHIITLIVEVLVLVAIPFLPRGIDDRLLVAIITVSAAMQNTSFRNIGTLTFNSTIMTGNLQNVANAFARGTWLRDEAARRRVVFLALVLVSFLLGAAGGATATARWHDWATLVPASALAIFAALLIWRRNAAS